MNKLIFIFLLAIPFCKAADNKSELYKAVKNHDLDKVSKLTESDGYDLDQALLHALSLYRYDIDDPGRDLSIVEFLLEKGAHLSAKDKQYFREYSQRPLAKERMEKFNKLVDSFDESIRMNIKGAD